ncbi:hypothetical protein LTR86_005125 [Recurvomyces mirabilis]|nr:hypothetical protein LTR86_005125 [Recurvomyces mirabilis]
MVLTAEGVVEQLMVATLISFAPRLLDVVRSSAPPTLAYFKGLPTECHRLWAVYLLVLKKPNSRPAIYIGSGTESDRGVKKRLATYDKKRDLPLHVDKRLHDGYEITYKGLLCWVPLPTASRRFAVRALLLLLETAFSLLFWAMTSRTKDYGELDGLTLEQINVKQVELEERRERQKWETYHGLKERDYAAWKALRRQYELNADPEKKKKRGKETKVRAKATGRFPCNHCVLKFATSTELNIHKGTNKHKDMVAGVSKPGREKYNAWASNNVAAKKHYCEHCDRAFKTSSKLKNHYNTGGHKNKVAAVEDEEDE